MDIGYARRTKLVYHKWCVGSSAKTRGKHFIRTKWILKKKHEDVARNKAGLDAQGYSQQEAIDYSETIEPVVKLESIRLLISFVVNYDIVLYQMDT